MKTFNRDDLREWLEYIVQDVDDIGSKPWIKVSLKSHARRHFKDQFSRNLVIDEEVDLWFSETKEIPNEEE